MLDNWKIIESYYKNRDLTSLQIESYDAFVTKNIPVIIKNQYINISINKFQSFVVYFQNVYVDKPFIYDSHRNKQTLFPTDARERDLSYETTVSCDIELILLDKKLNQIISSQTYSKVELFKLPVMINSSLCNLKTVVDITNEDPYNNGGYFIIKGKERVIVAQERINYNQIYVYKQKTKYRYIAEIRSIKESADYSVLLQAKIRNDNKLFFTVPYISQDIPIAILFLAMGSTVDSVFENIEKESTMYNIMTKEFYPYTHMSKDDCIEFISEYTVNKVDDTRKIRYTCHIIDTEILPHMGNCVAASIKSIFLLKLLSKLINTDNGTRIEDDRDHICNKRVEMVGDLLANLINSLFKRSIKSIQQIIEKRDDVCKLDDINIVNIINRCNISQRLYYCFTTGNWGIPKSNYIRQGVSQVLSRLSYIGMLSHIRRIVVPIGKESRNTQVRLIHSTNYGFICPVECYDPKTPILTWSGEIKQAADIVVGDQLIGSDGIPTTVNKTCSGKTLMYEIQPVKKNFMKYTVTSNHLLVFKATKHKKIHFRRNRYVVFRFDNKLLRYIEKAFVIKEDAISYNSTIDDDPIKIKVEDYIKLSKNVQKELTTYKAPGIHWPKQDVLLDPYLLGMWLGDGLSTGYGFATNDPECLEYWTRWAENNECKVYHHGRYQYGISHIDNTKENENTKGKSAFREHLKCYNLINNKYIPMEYIRNDRNTRLQLLAGLVDTDGSVRKGREIRICQGPKNARIIEDAIFLARSLGFNCHLNDGKSQWTHTFKDGTTEKRYSTYTELTITGELLCDIPTRVPNKKLEPFTRQYCENYNRSRIVVVEKGVDDFVGWQLTENSLFLLPDCTTVSNTPEGQSVGIIKSFSLLTKVSNNIDTVYIVDIIDNLFSHIPRTYELISVYCIYINGIWIGSIHPDTYLNFIQLFKHFRSLNIIPATVSISVDDTDKEINISSDSGRILRPVINVDKIAQLQSFIDSCTLDNLWPTLLDETVVVYIDGNEAESSIIAMYPDDIERNNAIQYDYCEVHPSLMMGICANTTPFPEHSQAPRNVYVSAMMKQAIGVYALSHRQRFDTIAHVLDYPQKKIVSTKIAQYTHCEEMASGMNAIVAIMCYGGQLFRPLFYGNIGQVRINGQHN